MPDSRQNRIPVTESILSLDDLQILGLHQICLGQRLGLAICGDQFFSADDIFFLKLMLKPLIDLVLCLRTLYNIQPVTARSFGILRSQNLNPVSVLDLIVNIDQLAVDTGSYHLVAHRTVDRIGKIHRSRTIWQVLHISVWSKTIHIFCKQIQIAF